MAQSSLSTVAVVGSSALIAYLLLVRRLRWRAYNNVHRKFANRIGSLSPADAQEIIHLSSSWDMPSIVTYALAFAILRTYGVASISRILVKTAELTNSESVSKRFLDTTIAAATWTLCPVDLSSPATPIVAAARESEDLNTRTEQDPRAFLAIARVNWLHGHYPILNDDYLLTLSLFIFEPPRWAQEYGWRRFSALEKEAWFVFYKHIGQLMKIKNIPESRDEMKEWAEAYEQECMLPAQVNREMADGMLRELSTGVPFFAKSLFQKLFICLFDARLRNAMMLPEQPAWAHAIVKYTLRSIAFFNRHFLLPRTRPRCIVPVVRPKRPEDGSLARMHPDWPVSRPWYSATPSGLGMLFEYIKVGFGFKSSDALPNAKYKPDGYRLEEMGPLKFENVGYDDVMQMAAEMMSCPVSGMWARPSTRTEVGKHKP